MRAALQILWEAFAFVAGLAGVLGLVFGAYVLLHV